MIHLHNWSEFLLAHSDQGFAAYIYFWIPHFIQLAGPWTSASFEKPLSALANTHVVRDYIQNELEARRLVGPLDRSLLPFLQVSPIGLVPKSHQTDKWHMIVGLPSLQGHSVDNGISPELSSLSYATMDDATECI